MTIRVLLVSQGRTTPEVNGAQIRTDSLQGLFENIDDVIVDLYSLKGRSGLRGTRYLWLAQATNYVKQVCSSYDVVILVGLEMAPLLRHVRGPIPVLDVCDSCIGVWRSSDVGPLRKVIALFNVLLLTTAARRAKIQLYITEEDRRQDRLLIRRGKVVRNRHRSALLAVSPVSRPKLQLGFVADFSYRPNVQGLRWFLDNVYPTLRKSGWRLDLFGPVMPPVSFVDGMRTRGYVERIEDVYRDIDVVIAPDFSGAGFKNKVSEGLLAARPVVTTARGARGQTARAGLFIADSAAGFIEAISGLRDERVVKRVSRQMRDESEVTGPQEDVARDILALVRV